MIDKCAIVLCTYNADINFFRQQIDSIFNQSHKNWVLHIFDDSENNSVVLDVINELKNIYKKKIIYKTGAKKGFAKNFIFGLLSLKKYDYYFFSDQDDIWFKDKLLISVQELKKNTKNNPGLFFCSQILIDEQNKILSKSKTNYSLSFLSAIIQNICSGNTICINHAFFVNLKKINFRNVILHDWALYLLAYGFSVKVIFYKFPLIYYRQHQDALIGGSTKLSDRFKRFNIGLNGNLKKYLMKQNDFCIDNIWAFKKKQKDIIYIFRKILNSSFFLKKLYYLFSTKIKRQSFLGQLALYILITFNFL